MYSILILQGNKSYLYATNSDGSKFTGDLTETKSKVESLMSIYPFGSLVVVHNTNMTTSVEIADVTE